MSFANLSFTPKMTTLREFANQAVAFTKATLSGTIDTGVPSTVAEGTPESFPNGWGLDTGRLISIDASQNGTNVNFAQIKSLTFTAKLLVTTEGTDWPKFAFYFADTQQMYVFGVDAPLTTDNNNYTIEVSGALPVLTNQSSFQILASSSPAVQTIIYLNINNFDVQPFIYKGGVTENDNF